MKKTIIAASLLALSSTAFAGIVVIGNPGTTVALTKDQASALYLGKSKNLPNGTKAVLMELTDGNADRDAFHSAVTGKSSAQIKASWARLVFTGKASAPKEHSSAEVMLAAVASTAGAVGYIDESLVDGTVTVLLKP